MAVVTITGNLGSMGSIARRLAQRLDYDILEPELALEASRLLNAPAEQQRAFDERTGGLGGRFMPLLREYVERSGEGSGRSMFVGGAVEDMMLRTYGDTSAPGMTADDRDYIATLSHVLEYFARRGNVVIVGRGSPAVLAGFEDAVHLGVFCALDERVRRVAQRAGGDERLARERVEESDRHRAAWHRKYFNFDYQDPEHYHYIVNSGRVSDETAAEVLAEAVQRFAR